MDKRMESTEGKEERTKINICLNIPAGMAIQAAGNQKSDMEKSQITVEVPLGTTVLELLKSGAVPAPEHPGLQTSKYLVALESPIVAAKVDYIIRELDYVLTKDCTVMFVDLRNEDGMRIYRRSLYFIYIKALHDLFPEAVTTLSHSVSKGLYCEVSGASLKPEDIRRVENRMRELSFAGIPFRKKILPLEEAKKFFLEASRQDKFDAVLYRLKNYVTLYEFDEMTDYFYGYMVPDSSYVKVFALIPYEKGVLLCFPEKSDPSGLPAYAPQPKLFQIFLEHKTWGKILNVSNISDLNKVVQSGAFDDYVRVAEGLHEKKLAMIADDISARKDKEKFVLIAGPSSSGKTTFANRLTVQLRVNGLQPFVISTDDYFLNREEIPYDENGEQDFESISIVDTSLLWDHLARLLAGEEVELPKFDFSSGHRVPGGRKIRLEEKNILVIEGIHGLNEQLTKNIKKENKYKIYLSALTSMNIDRYNRVPSSDIRLMRRIVRDSQRRNTSPVETIRMWKSVRRGEEKNIFPYQEEADVMFNSALIYELAVLKPYAMPLLENVSNDCEEYSEVVRLKEFLSYVVSGEEGAIPQNSILREFIGGSCFEV